MPSSKKDKQYANVRARRHSSDIIINQSKKSKKDKEKDTDTESVTSSSASSADTVVPAPPPKKQCPLRSLYSVLMEPESNNKGKGGCPFRRVQLWHTIPLCILAIVIPLLVGVTVLISLVGLAGYRISMGIQGAVVNLMKANPTLRVYVESLAETDDGATLVAEEKH